MRSSSQKPSTANPAACGALRPSGAAASQAAACSAKNSRYSAHSAPHRHVGGDGRQLLQRAQPGPKTVGRAGRRLPLQTASHQAVQPRPHRQREHKRQHCLQQAAAIHPAKPPLHQTAAHCGKVGVGGGQQRPGGGAQPQRDRRGQRGHSGLPQPEPAVQQRPRPGCQCADALEKAAERQRDEPGQRVEEAETAAVPLRQHAAARQHIPHRKQVPHQHLPPGQGRLLAICPQRRRQREPTRRPQPRFGRVPPPQRAGQHLDSGDKGCRKGRHLPPGETVVQKDAARVQVGQRVAGRRSPEIRRGRRFRPGLGRTCIKGTPRALFAWFGHG